MEAIDYVAQELEFECIESGVSMFYHWHDVKSKLGYGAAGGWVDYNAIDFEADVAKVFDLLVRFEKNRREGD